MSSSGLLCACATAALLFAAPAAAEEAPDFRGKTVTLVASFEAGGPYDFYSRLVARYIGPHLPGSPNVIVQNMPGAGGLRGANFMFNVAPRDGTVMGVVSQTIAVGQALAAPRASPMTHASSTGSAASTPMSRWSTAGSVRHQEHRGCQAARGYRRPVPGRHRPRWSFRGS